MGLEPCCKEMAVQQGSETGQNTQDPALEQGNDAFCAVLKQVL